MTNSNKIYLILFCVMSFIFTISCKETATLPPPAPFAVFDFSKDGGEPPLEISFTNKSSNTQTYVWDFGDNTPTSTELSPKHIYTAAGTYTVTLTATGKGGTTKAQQSIFVNKKISRVFVSAIIIEQFATTKPTSQPWDANSAPDLFLTITSPLPSSTPVIYRQVNEIMYRDIEQKNLPFTHPLEAAKELISLDNNFSVNLYDNDNTNVNEFMGNVIFKFSDYTTGTNPYPTTVRKSNGDYTISLVIFWSR